MAVTVRAASPADDAGIAAVALAHAHGPSDSGRSPEYLALLRATGRLAVAVADGVIVGFGGAFPVGDVIMLSDLFVLPSSQGSGAGSSLLGYLLDGYPRRMTFASSDPRALALYTRAGMTARWALLYLTGSPGRLGRNPVVSPASSSLEMEWTGVDRSAAYAFWGTAYSVGSPPVAVGVSSRPGVLAHVAVAPGVASGEALLDAVAACPGSSVRVCVPSVHPGLPALLTAGFTISGFDLYMTTEAGMVGEALGAYEPGLC